MGDTRERLVQFRELGKVQPRVTEPPNKVTEPETPIPT